MTLPTSVLGAALTSALALGCAGGAELDSAFSYDYAEPLNPCGALTDHVAGDEADYARQGGLVVVTDALVYPEEGTTIGADEPFSIAWTIYNGSSASLGNDGTGADSIVSVAAPSRDAARGGKPAADIPYVYSPQFPMQSSGGAPSLYSPNSYVAACGDASSCSLGEADPAAPIEPGGYGLMVASFVAGDSRPNFFLWGAALVDGSTGELLEASGAPGRPALRDLFCENLDGSGASPSEAAHDSAGHLNETEGVAVIRMTPAVFDDDASY